VSQPEPLSKKEENEDIEQIQPIATLENNFKVAGIDTSGLSGSQVFCYGNAECDEFQVSETVFESKRPILIHLKTPQKLVQVVCGA
jgi:hypothetical protein